MKSIDDAPDGAEQAHERGYGGCDRQPGHVAFKARDLFGACNLHGALNRDAATLAAVFREASLEYCDQWAGFELLGHS